MLLLRQQSLRIYFCYIAHCCTLLANVPAKYSEGVVLLGAIQLLLLVLRLLLFTLMMLLLPTPYSALRFDVELLRSVFSAAIPVATARVW